MDRCITEFSGYFMRYRLVVLLSFVFLKAAAAAQTPGAVPAPQPPVSGVGGSSEIVVDFVARDSHSRPVRDLRPEEVKITDGGVSVKIARLQLMSGAGAGAGQQSQAAPRMVSFIFDGLDAYASGPARKAAVGVLNSLIGTGASFSVWRIADRMELLQTFTKDGAALNKAIEAATAPPRTPLAGSAAAAPPSGDPLAESAQGTIARWERIERDEKLRPQIASLVALSRQQAPIKGRKAIVYFSDGAQLEACPPEQLRSAIGSANRASVMLYTLNIGGLSQAAEKKASSILDSSAPAGDGQPAAAAPAAKPADSLKFTFIQLDADTGPRIPLRDLAESTGGLYIRRSGELSTAVGKIVDDLTTYYEASYVSPVQEPNGQFRPVSVRVSRAQTYLQSRSGYFALPEGLDTAPFEVPLLKALGRPERAETIPFQTDVVHLGGTAAKARGEVVLELPLAGIDCKADPALGLCDMHFSVLVLIKNAQGQVLQKFSQDVPDQMASEGVESVRGGAYSFQRSFVLPSGDYHLEAAVMDRQVNKVSSKNTSFSLSVTQDLAVCDLFLVRGLAPLESRPDPEDPLRYQDGRVMPLLIPVWRGADRDVQVFFLVAPDAKIATAPRVVVEVERDNRLVERPAIKVVDRRPGAPIPVTAMLKRSLLEPGHYKLLVKVTQGKESLEKKINFEVLTRPAPVIPEQPLADASKGGAAVDGVAELVDVKLIEGVQKPDDADLKRIIAAARERAADYRSALPDFVCTRTTTKSTKRKGPGEWAPGIATTDLLQYVEGAEKTQTLTTKQVANVPAVMKKVELSGELGGVLSLVFNEDHAADIQWQGMADFKGGRVHVLQYQVARKNSGYLLSLGETGSQVLAAYRGVVLIDANTMTIRRVVVEAIELPKNFPIQQSAISVDYDYVRIAGKRYLVPQRATWVYVGSNSRQPMKTDRVFQNYRKYTTTSGIKYMGEASKNN